MELFKLLGTIAIDNSAANKAIDETAGKASSSESAMSGAFKKIGAAVATYFTTTAIINFGKDCVNAASDVQEMQNKFDVVFSGMTDTVSQWAEDYASSIGRNSNTIKGYLADNQNMFVGMGMTREAGADLSEQMVSLALDLASFNNLSEPDAVNALSKALMGESESAKSLGAVLNDNTIAMAMNKMGIEGKFDALSEAEKMEVRYQAILMQSTDAVGDCERSLDSYKGRTLQLQSAKEKLYETIGQMLLPIMTQFVGALTTAVTWVQSAVEWGQQHQTVMQLIGIAVAAVTTAIIAYNTAQALATLGNAGAVTAITAHTVALGLQTVATGIATAATTAFGAAVAFLTSPITIAIAAIAAIIAIGVLLYKNWDTIKEKAKELGEGIKQKWEDLKTATSEKFNAVKQTMTDAMSIAKQEISSRLGEIKKAYDENGGGIKGIAAATMEAYKQYYKVGFDAVNKLTGGKLGEIAEKFKEKMGAAAKFVSDAINKIKGFFNFKWSLPKLKMPHFKISGNFSLNPPSIPKIGVDWYKKAMNNGMILNGATIFGQKDGKFLGGGEAGSETVVGTQNLMRMITQAASYNQFSLEDLQTIIHAAVSLALQEVGMKLEVEATASETGIFNTVVAKNVEFKNRHGGKSAFA